MAARRTILLAAILNLLKKLCFKKSQRPLINNIDTSILYNGRYHFTDRRITMFRNYRNYKIQRRKDGRYTARVMDQGHTTSFYGRTKKEVQRKLEVYIDELNSSAQTKYEMSHPTKYMTLRNWAYLCLNTYCVANIQGNTHAAYERLIRLHFGELGDMPVGRISSLMVQKHITTRSH